LAAVLAAAATLAAAMRVFERREYVLGQ